MNKEDLEKIIKSNVDRPMHFGGAFKDDSFNKVMGAIDQYAQSQTEALKKEIEELRKERDGLQKTLNKLGTKKPTSNTTT